MEILMEWLKAGVPLSQLWLYILGGIASTFIYDLILYGITRLLGMEIEFFGGFKDFGLNWLLLFFIVFIEELIFRFPLAIVVIFLGQSAWVILAAAIISAVFGWLHGRRVVNLLAQGIPGFWWCLLFLKCSGFCQGFVNVVLAFVVVVSIHFFTNLFYLAVGRVDKQNGFRI